MTDVEVLAPGTAVIRMADTADIEQAHNPARAAVEVLSEARYLLDQASRDEDIDRLIELKDGAELNDVLAVRALDRFRVGVVAGREKESDIDRIVRAQGLVVSQDKIPGAIAAVRTLHRIYDRADDKTLGRTLRIVRDAYGDAGLEAAVIDGIGFLCQRYNGEMDDQAAIGRLGSINGGVNGLVNAAEQVRRKTGKAKGQCVAAAAVEIINRGKGGKKLPSWWKD